MATGANTTPLGRLHPVLQARSGFSQEPLLPLPGSMPGVSMPGVSMPGVSMPGVSMPGVGMPGVSMPGVSMGGVGGGGGGGGGGGSKDPELKRHLEAAKRAASALFPGVWTTCVLHVCLCVCILVYVAWFPFSHMPSFHCSQYEK